MSYILNKTCFGDVRLHYFSGYSFVFESSPWTKEIKAAEAVLAKEKEQHRSESAEEDAAAAKLPPQEEKVHQMTEDGHGYLQRPL